jgi:ribosomal protein S25
MNTEQTTRPPFKVQGSATIKHLNVRKEGPEDEKIIAVDIKLEIKQVDRRLCAYFDDALEAFLWRGDTDALIARNMYLQPVAFSNLITGATFTIESQTFVGCEVKKFAMEPRDGGVMSLTCSVSVYPLASEVSNLAKLVQDDAHIAIEGPPDLFSGQAESEAKAQTMKAAQQLPESLIELALTLVQAPEGKASISYLQRKMKIGYNQAARVMEILEKDGIVGPMLANGTRKVIGGAA